MKKFLYLSACLLTFSMAASAQTWTKPAAPASTPLAVGETRYLYNKEADGFFLGANDWSTRASYNPTRGYKVSIDKYELNDVAWDGESYFITDSIEDGTPAGQVLCLFISDVNSLWVDQAKTTSSEKGFTFIDQGDGTYKIGLSPQNANFNPTVYEDVYLGVSPSKKDTRLYLIDTNEETDGQIIWYFVMPADYEAYVTAVKQYNAAVALGGAISDAQTRFPSVDISAVTAVYDNQNSTAEELTAARLQLLEILLDYASADNPVDATDLITNPSYDNNDNTGWSGTVPAFQQYGNAEFFSKNYTSSQTLSGLHDGVYGVRLTAFYRAGSSDNDAVALTALNNRNRQYQNAKLYATGAVPTLTAPLPFISTGATEEALGSGTVKNSFGYIPNDMATAATYFDAGQYQPTAVVVPVADGTLTFGLSKQTVIENDWTLFDSWQLTYYGSGDDAYTYLRDTTLAASVDYEALVNASDTLVYCSHAAYEGYLAARQALAAATTADAVTTALADFVAANDSLQASIDAYATYAAAVLEATDFIEERGDELMGEDMDILSDYLTLDDGPSADLPELPNGSAAYILTNGSLTTVEIIAETAFLAELRNKAVSNGMSDGTDCTALIQNPHFSETGGWTKVGLPEFPLGTDTYKLAQGYSIVFDVYQEITGLQEGLYELTLNDLYRPANYDNEGYETNHNAYVYMNDFEANLNTIESGATEESASDDDTFIDGTGYVPNSVTGAANAFEAGRYGQTLYGLVTDGNLKIGVRNDLRYEGCWAVWSDFKLTFRAKNPEVLAEVVNSMIPSAQALLTNKCGQPELSTLSTAITAAQEAADNDRYDALVSLKQAMDSVTVCTDTYVTLNTAIANLQQTISDYSSSDQIADAQALYTEASAAYEAGTYSNAEASAKTLEINALIVSIKLGGNTGGGTEQDVTSLIVNPTFDPSRGSKDSGTIEGWTTSAMNGYKENTVSYNRAGIDLYQTLTGLPKGKYKVTVHTYYRAGYADEDYTLWQEDPSKSHLTTLYATTSDSTASTLVMNLCEDAQSTQVGDSKCDQLSNGLYVPNGTSATVIWFNAGYYLNELEFTVPEDGTVTIGLKKTEVLANDYEVVGAWNLYYYGDEDEKQDVTSLIVNPTFDPSRGSKDSGTIEGWTTSAMNGYKENTVSYNRAGIDLYQTLTGLPKGKYKVTVHTYYRAGYADEDYTLWQEDPSKSHLTTLYATTSDSTASTLVMNLCEDAQSTQVGDSKCDQLSNGLYVPNGTSATVIWFNAGYYLNELEFTVPEDGTVTIGLKKTEVLANDYEVVGAWNLYYYGDKTATGIRDTDIDAAAPSGNATPMDYYSISGTRLTRPQPGLNIVRMSDGTTRKIFIR